MNKSTQLAKLECADAAEDRAFAALVRSDLKWWMKERTGWRWRLRERFYTYFLPITALACLGAFCLGLGSLITWAVS